MPDELVMAVATALAVRGADAVMSGGRSAFAALYRLIRARLDAEPETATRGPTALEAAMAEPQETPRQVDLAVQLGRLMARDPAFDAAVRGYWHDAVTEFSADRKAVVNHFSGSADKVVQARDIRGDISL